VLPTALTIPEWLLRSPETVLTPPESVLTIPEWALTITGTPAHDPGIGAQDRPESPLTMVRNTQLAAPGFGRREPVSD
jgi:hypothetical protein